MSTPERERAEGIEAQVPRGRGELDRWTRRPTEAELIHILGEVTLFLSVNVQTQEGIAAKIKLYRLTDALQAFPLSPGSSPSARGEGSEADPRGKNIFQWQEDARVARRLDAIWNIISSPRSYSVHEIRGALAALCDAVAATSQESI